MSYVLIFLKIILAGFAASKRIDTMHPTPVLSSNLPHISFYHAANDQWLLRFNIQGIPRLQHRPNPLADHELEVFRKISVEVIRPGNHRQSKKQKMKRESANCPRPRCRHCHHKHLSSERRTHTQSTHMYIYNHIYIY